jgi:hypothetical protein
VTESAFELVAYRDDEGRVPFQVWFAALERRIDWGPAYRIYLGRDGERLVILLGGGTKQRQQRDIAAAQERAGRDPAFAGALLEEAVECLLAGDLPTARSLIRDVIKGSMGYGQLSHCQHQGHASALDHLGAAVGSDHVFPGTL